MAILDNLVLAVFGRKGSGKSHLTKQIIQEFDRVVAIDSLAEYGPDDGFRVVSGKRACAEALVKASKLTRFKLSLRCDDHQDLLQLLEVVYEMPGTLVVVDEASFYCSPTKLPVPMSKLIRMGRHKRISQIYVARRPSEVHRDVTAQADVTVTFVQHEPRDILYLRGVAGDDAERARSLGKYKCLAWGVMEKCPTAVLAQMERGGEQMRLDEGDDAR